MQPAETLKYCESFKNNQILGSRLLHLTVSDLIKLNVEKLGHQEIILEGLEKLKNLHYNLSTENLQFIALKLSCKARSLHNEICMLENQTKNAGGTQQPHRDKVNTCTMTAVADVLDALMAMLTWLDKPPFANIDDKSPYKAIWKAYVNLGIKLATNAQRDTFAENPVQVIKDCCLSLANVSDTLIRDIEDPLILQPSALEVVTAKKRPGEQDFGLVIDHAQAHVIGEVKFGSLAYTCGRIHPGDEVVQVNYQTVVGWSTKNIISEINGDIDSSEIILTLKKIPKLLDRGDRLYIQPFPLPKEPKKANNPVKTDTFALSSNTSYQTEPK